MMVNLASTKSDLLDRDLIIKVERIDDKFKRKKQWWREFQKISHSYQATYPDIGQSYEADYYLMNGNKFDDRLSV